MLGGRVRLSLRVMVCGTGSERVVPRHHRGTAMEHFAGIDVSLKDSSICVVDAAGRIVREAKVASEPEALVAWFRGLGFAVTRIGLEAGPLSQWLHAGLSGAGLRLFCWRPGTSRQRCRRWWSRPTARTPAASRSCCGWAGSGRCTAQEVVDSELAG